MMCSSLPAPLQHSQEYGLKLQLGSLIFSVLSFSAKQGPKEVAGSVQGYILLEQYTQVY